MILGTGTLLDAEPGVRRGYATFPVRGEKPVTLDLLARNNDGWVARLTVGEDRGKVSLINKEWLGHITIEGYPMKVTISPQWEITFND